MNRNLTPESIHRSNPRRICIIKPTAFGDVVQALPLLGGLKSVFPQAEISWVIDSGLAALLDGHPLISGLIPFQRRGGVREWIRILRQLKTARFDLVFDLQGLFRTGLLTAATSSRLRIGLETAREGSNLSCHLLVPDTGSLVPAYDRYLQVARWLGYNGPRPSAMLAISESDRAWASANLTLNQPLKIAIHPGARWSSKQWPVDKFATVAIRAARELDAGLVIVGGPDERPLAALLRSHISAELPQAQVADLCGRSTLKQLAAILQNVDMLITNDSGPMHLAAAMNTPVVGIFTCTSSVRSGPGPGMHELVSTHLPCGAMYRKTCPYSGNARHACFAELTVDRVWAAVLRLAEKLKHARSAA